MTKAQKDVIKNQTQNAMEQDALRNNRNTLAVVQSQLDGFFNQNKAQIIKALPKHIDANKMVNLAVTCISRNPELLACEPTSLLQCVVESSKLGLQPSVLGEAYLVPYYNGRKGFKEAQFQIGYKGLMSLARRSGEIQTINANEVRENDKFSYSFGMNEHLDHIPAKKDRGDILYFYAYSKLKDGGFQFVVMSKEEVDIIAASAKTNNVWKNHYVEMGKKTVIKRLCKMLPMSIEYNNAIDKDDKSTMGEEQDLDFTGMLTNTLSNNTEPFATTEPAKNKAKQEIETNINDFIAEMKKNETLVELKNWMTWESVQLQMDALNSKDSNEFKKVYDKYFKELSKKDGFTNG